MIRSATARLGVRSIVLLSLLPFLWGCPQPNGGGSGGGGSNASQDFSWVSPAAEESASLGITRYGATEAKALSRFVVADSGEEVKTIEPDSLKMAFSYIALVPDSIGKAIWNTGSGDGTGLQCYRLDSDWVTSDNEDLQNTSKVPGYNRSNNRDGPTPVFEAYVDEATPVTRAEVMEASFVIFQGTTGTPFYIMDIYGETVPVTMDDVPKDQSVAYTGVAYEIVYQEIEIAGYGIIRFYLNDHGPYKAGDVLAHKDVWDEGVWKWVYLRHGNGPDEGCLTRTSNDPSYLSVNAPDDPDNLSGGWSMQPYDGLYEGFYTFLYEKDLHIFHSSDPGSGNTNWAKRPSGSGNYSYWIVCDEVMYKGFGSEFQGYTSSHFDLDTNPGGFKSFSPTGDPSGNLPYGSAEGRNVGGTGSADIQPYETQHRAFLVHHESDYHRGTEDLSQVVYFDARLDDSMVLSRDDLYRQYGRYAYDCGLYTRLYDESAILYGYGGNSIDHVTFEGAWNLLINPLYFQLGRMCVYAAPPPGSDSVSPSYGDDIEDRIISMEVEMEFEAALIARTDSLGLAYDGSAVAGTDFEKRFLYHIPAWPVPSEPTAWVYQFKGADDAIKPPMSLALRPGRFEIRHRYLRYSDVYSPPLRLSPDPTEGPFDGNVSVGIAMERDAEGMIFYTIDGSTPAYDANGTPQGTTALYSGPITIARGEPTTLTAIGRESSREGYKEPSAASVATYSFTQAGFVLSGTIPDSPAATGVTIFAAFFGSRSIDLSKVQYALFHAELQDNGGALSYYLKDIPVGQYYLCALADVDGNGSPSLGDAIYPAHTSSPLETRIIDCADDPINVGGATGKNFTGSWSTL